MSSQHDAALKQVTTLIKKKWCQECTDILDKLFTGFPDDIYNISDSIENSTGSSTGITISKIKERLDSLESINDHLYYTLCYLVENLPDLISKTITSNAEMCRNLSVISNTSHNIPFTTIHENENLASPRPTRREKDILQLLEKGLCAKEIASRLYISETTVITHKKNLKKKFNVKNTVELISILRNT